jgi:hypothetical protein
MKIVRPNEDLLKVVDFPIDIGVVSSLFVIVALVGFIQDIVSGVYSTRREVGMAVCALAGLGAAALFIKRSVFEFDRRRRILTWRRDGLFRAKAGCVPFDKIRAATVESITGDSTSVLRYRTAVATDDGTIPITEYYTLGGGERCERTRDEINRFVDPEAVVSADNDIREMARAGHSVRAVAMAKQKLGLSTSEAVRYVDQARDSGGSAP